MGAFGTKLRSIEGGRLMFRCPGCESFHTVTSAWDFNGDGNAPTFAPSVLVRGVASLTDEQMLVWTMGGPLPDPVKTVCHSFVNSGRIQFLGDSTHALAGQTVDLPDIEDAA